MDTMNILNTQQVKKSVFEANDEFPFQDLSLHKPISVLGEPQHFLIKIHLGTKTTPVYVQTPSCHLKDGGFSKAGKQTVADFILSNENSEFLLWMEKLEDFCRAQLLAKQSDWFETQLTEEDFDSLFLPPYKVVKGKGGKLVSVRASLPINNKVKIFNEAQEEVDYVEPFHTDQSVISVLEIMGIKCSPRHFHIDFVVRQMMLLKETPLFSQCLISSKETTTEVKETVLKEAKEAIKEEEVREEKPQEEVKEQTRAMEEKPQEEVKAEPREEEPIEELELMEEHEILKDLEEMDEEKIELDIQDFDLESESEAESEDTKDFSEQILEKAKKARHLGIMEVLKSRQITFDPDKLRFME